MNLWIRVAFHSDWLSCTNWHMFTSWKLWFKTCYCEEQVLQNMNRKQFRSVLFWEGTHAWQYEKEKKNNLNHLLASVPLLECIQLPAIWEFIQGKTSHVKQHLDRLLSRRFTHQKGKSGEKLQSSSTSLSVRFVAQCLLLVARISAFALRRMCTQLPTGLHMCHFQFNPWIISKSFKIWICTFQILRVQPVILLSLCLQYLWFI